MFEAILVVLIINAVLYMPMGGKRFEALSPAQQQRAIKNHTRYLNSKKGKLTPNMSIEEYLPTLQKQGRISMIAAIVMLPIYILIVVFYYSQIF